MTLGEKIRAYRQDLGISQTQLAHECGYKTKASICAIEYGKQTVPIERIKKIAKALNIKAEDLIEDLIKDETEDEIEEAIGDES